jgi:hypothetical protein
MPASNFWLMWLLLLEALPLPISGAYNYKKFPTQIIINPANRLQELNRSVSLARRKLDETGCLHTESLTIYTWHQTAFARLVSAGIYLGHIYEPIAPVSQYNPNSGSATRPHPNDNLSLQLWEVQYQGRFGTTKNRPDDILGPWTSNLNFPSTP